MHYLRLGLSAEGPSDHRFLPLVLQRLAVDLCARRTPRRIDVEEEVLDLSFASSGKEDRAERIRAALRSSAGRINVLFIHADGGGDPAAARELHFHPWLERMSSELGLGDSRLVAVIPIREMEAWALVDGDALRKAFGTVLNDAALGVPPRPREVEAIFDPKWALDRAYRAVVGRRRRSRERAARFLSAIGERVRLERLRQVPAFQELEHDLKQALDDLGYFR